MGQIRLPLQPPRDPLISDAMYDYLTALNTALTALVGNLTPLPAPNGVATAGYSAAVRIVWSEVLGADAYRVYEGTVNTFASATLIGTVPANRGGASNSYTRSGLADTTARYYFIQALAGNGTVGTPSAGKAGAAASVPLGVGTTLDQINDGTAYARPLAARISSGKPLIDFSEGIHINKNLDNVSDGASYLRTTGNEKTGAGRAYNALDSNNRLAGSFRNNPVNVNAATTTTGNVLTQSGTSTTINVAAFTIQYGDGQVSYNSGSVNPGTYGKFAIYFDDPQFAGGAVTYQYSSHQYDGFGGNGRILLGIITTASGGGGGGGGGGGDPCFAPSVLVRTNLGNYPISYIKRGDLVVTNKGLRPVRWVKVTPYNGVVYDMGNHELVTPEHKFLIGTSILPAKQLWTPTEHYEGFVWNLAIDTEHEEERNYVLGNGMVSHNILPLQC